MENIDNWFQNNPKKVEGIFFGAIILNILALIEVAIRNRDHVSPFTYRPLDIYFFVYMAAFIIGGITVFQLVKYYYEFRSYDYLLIAMIVYGYVVSYPLYQWFADYFTDIWITFDFPAWWFEFGFFGQGYFFLSDVLLLVFLVRIHGWQQKKRGEKGFIIFLGYHLVVTFLGYLETAIDVEHVMATNWEKRIMDSLSIFYHFNPIEGVTIENYSMILLYFYTIWTFFRVKNFSNFESIKYTRILWISMGILSLIIRPIFVYYQFIRIDFDSNFLTANNIYISGQLILALLVLVTHGYYPESSLISKPQLLRAKHLYKLVDKEANRADSIIGYRERMVEYIQSLPQDLVKEIKVLKSMIRSWY